MPPVTAKVPGDGTNTLTFTIPGAGMDVETVYIEVDGSGAGGAITGTLSIADQSGVVIAAKPQDDTMDASANVSATWALRLNDKSAAIAPASGGTPSVATFYRSPNFGDPNLTVAAGATKNITWLHAALPSDGSITGPLVGNQYIEFEVPCITLEMLYTQWDDAGYLKASVIGTDSRIIEADQYALANAGIGALSGTGIPFGDSTEFVRPNAHKANDLVHAYAQNGDTASHDLLSAYLVVYLWPAPGYAGGIPGWPA